MSDKATIHDCIRCNGSGHIWARPNHKGEIVPIAADANIGLGAVSLKSPYSMTTSDRPIVCDWCGGARRVKVEGVKDGKIGEGQPLERETAMYVLRSCSLAVCDRAGMDARRIGGNQVTLEDRGWPMRRAFRRAVIMEMRGLTIDE